MMRWIGGLGGGVWPVGRDLGCWFRVGGRGFGRFWRRRVEASRRRFGRASRDGILGRGMIRLRI